jgi:hypothetical protein
MKNIFSGYKKTVMIRKTEDAEKRFEYQIFLCIGWFDPTQAIDNKAKEVKTHGTTRSHSQF